MYNVIQKGKQPATHSILVQQARLQACPITTIVNKQYLRTAAAMQHRMSSAHCQENRESIRGFQSCYTSNWQNKRRAAAVILHEPVFLGLGRKKSSKYNTTLNLLTASGQPLDVPRSHRHESHTATGFPQNVCGIIINYG